MSKVLSITGLNYSISKADILTDLSLEVSEGDYFAIAGINGAGKTTLIRLILDLVRPSNNCQVKLYGSNNRDQESRYRLAYLPEKFDINKLVTGWQYLKFVGSIYRRGVQTFLIEDLCRKLEFPVDKLGKEIRSYSKGMVQKLGIVSCFMLEREFLILDEPLSGLDPQARYCFKRLLLEEKTRGRTMFYSTHMLADAEEICDQFGILHNGKLRFVGTPEECCVTYGGDSLEQAYINCINR